MVNRDGIFTIDDVNKETTSELFEQLGTLVDVGPRRDGKRYLSDICIGEGVNKWAANKSIRETSKKVNITEEDRAKQFYGFDIQEIFCANSEETLNVALSNGADYPYLKPRGSAVSPVEWFRLRDFNGYNPNAEIPYKYTIQNNPARAEQWVDVYLNPNGELLLSQIAPTEISLDIMDYKIALVYRNRETSVMNGVIASDTIADVEAGAQPIIHYTLDRAGTYDMVLAITNATYWDQEDTEWIYLPEAVFTASYDPSLASFKIFYNDDNALVGVNSNGAPISSNSVLVEGIRLDIRLDSGEEAIDGRLIIEFNSEYSGSGVWEEEIAYEGDYSLDKNDSVYFREDRLPYYFTNPYVNRIYVKARIEYKPRGSLSAPDIRHIDLLTFDGVSPLVLSDEEFAPVTLKDIINSTNW